MLQEASTDVFIVADPRDVHAQSVGKRIEELGGTFHIFDTRQAPELELTWDLDVTPGLEINGRSLSGARSLWWRRPQNPFLGGRDRSYEVQRFLRAEWLAALKGGISTIAPPVINNPLAEQRATNKMLQLQAAKSCGISCPRTIVTNRADHASAFVRSNLSQGKRTIFKPLTPPFEQLGEARLIESVEGVEERLTQAPIIFQECIERGLDLRVTVVGGDMYAASIEMPGGGSEDWRVHAALKYRPYKLSEYTAQLVLRLMAILGLSMACIDLRLDRKGEVYFFEVNPSGQFLFIELECGLPISTSFARALMGGLVSPRSGVANHH